MLYCLIISLSILSSFLFASSNEFSGWGNTILHHVADSNTVLIYNIPISKHVIMLLISATVTALMAIWATRNYRKNLGAQPKGLAHLYEILIDFINKEIVYQNIGKEHAKTWTPVAMTFFIFILTCNLLGLVPFFEKLTMFGGGGSTVTANFGVTAGLACITFLQLL